MHKKRNVTDQVMSGVRPEGDGASVCATQALRFNREERTVGGAYRDHAAGLTLSMPPLFG